MGSVFCFWIFNTTFQMVRECWNPSLRLLFLIEINIWMRWFRQHHEICLSLAHVCKDTEIHTTTASTCSGTLGPFQTAFLFTPDWNWTWRNMLMSSEHRNYPTFPLRLSPLPFPKRTHASWSRNALLQKHLLASPFIKACIHVFTTSTHNLTLLK